MSKNDSCWVSKTPSRVKNIGFISVINLRRCVQGEESYKSTIQGCQKDCQKFAQIIS